MLIITGLTLALLVMMFLWATVAGSDGMSISFGAGRVNNPALWQVVVVAVLIAAAVGVPFAVLMSARARRQFGEDPAAA